MKEIPRTGTDATLVVVALLVFSASTVYSLATSLTDVSPDWIRVGILAVTAVGLLACLRGFVTVAPGSALILLSGGRYVGTLRETGAWWISPLFSRLRVSLQVHSHHTGLIGATDLLGDPLEISATVEWRVADTAITQFLIEDPSTLLADRARSALQDMTRKYPFNADGLDSPCLKFNAVDLANELQYSIAERVAVDGIEIVSVSLGQINYAKEYLSARVNANHLRNLLISKLISVDERDSVGLRLVSGGMILNK
jgi:regulator of protease activity HflC (stomatin/prohibitin superfamily)